MCLGGEIETTARDPVPSRPKPGSHCELERIAAEEYKTPFFAQLCDPSTASQPDNHHLHSTSGTNPYPKLSMRASGRPPELLVNVRTPASGAVVTSPHTKIAFVLKPSAEPSKTETSPDEDALVKSHQRGLRGEPSHSRTAANDLAPVSAGERFRSDWRSSDHGREENTGAENDPTRQSHIHIHRLYHPLRQKPAPTAMPHTPEHRIYYKDHRYYLQGHPSCESNSHQ